LSETIAVFTLITERLSRTCPKSSTDMASRMFAVGNQLIEAGHEGVLEDCPGHPGREKTGRFHFAIDLLTY
jgi:hypothetical protein